MFGGSRPVVIENLAGFGVGSFPEEELNNVLGLWILEAAVNNPGQGVKFTINLPNPLPIGAKIFKLNSFGAWVDITNSVQISSNRKSISWTVYDGGLLDFDGSENGVITDPVGFFGGSGAGVGGGGGGGCYVNPKSNKNTPDSGIIILTLLSLLYVLYRATRLILGSYLSKDNIF
jgi:hypothetical protein